MPNADENKAIVKKFFSLGFGADESRALVVEDFRWIGPASLEFVFDRETHANRGPELLKDLPNIEAALYKRSELESASTNLHFIIAEDDIVVLEFDARRTTFEDESYRNNYCLVFFMRDGKIAKVHEHVDSHYSWNLCFNTPEKRDGVLDRLGRLRA